MEDAGFKTIDGPRVGDFLLKCTPVRRIDETFRGEEEGLEDLDRDTCEPKFIIHPQETILATHDGREMSVEHLQLEPRIYPLGAKGSKDGSRSVSVREVMLMTTLKILVYYLSASIISSLIRIIRKGGTYRCTIKNKSRAKTFWLQACLSVVQLHLKEFQSLSILL